MSKVVKGPRIRGHAYQLKSGLWTYFLRVGDEKSEGGETTFHPDLAWETKEDALRALQEHVDFAIKGTGALVVHKGGGEP